MIFSYKISGIDTRALTKKIREKGTMLGKVLTVKYF
jgi:carbamoylphosphate synthase small subunit